MGGRGMTKDDKLELMMVLSELELLISLSHLRFPSHLHNRFTDALNKLKADIIK
jgi:hypothetical protein